jgi:hypothetical protein
MSLFVGNHRDKIIIWTYLINRWLTWQNLSNAFEVLRTLLASRKIVNLFDTEASGAACLMWPSSCFLRLVSKAMLNSEHKLNCWKRRDACYKTVDYRATNTKKRCQDTGLGVAGVQFCRGERQIEMFWCLNKITGFKLWIAWLLEHAVVAAAAAAAAAAVVG